MIRLRTVGPGPAPLSAIRALHAASAVLTGPRRLGKLRRPLLVHCAFLVSVCRSEPAAAVCSYLWGAFLRICCIPGKLTSRGP